jgi:hypothetical protein
MFKSINKADVFHFRLIRFKFTKLLQNRNWVILSFDDLDVEKSRLKLIQSVLSDDLGGWLRCVDSGDNIATPSLVTLSYTTKIYTNMSTHEVTLIGQIKIK